MTSKETTERMLFLADYFVNGNVPDTSAELRKGILKNFGEDFVGQKEVPDPGFFSAVKRVFGLGGTHTKRVLLKDKMGEMSDDDLRTYLGEVYEKGVKGFNGNSPDFLNFGGRQALNALDYFDQYIHDVREEYDPYRGVLNYEMQEGFLPSAKTQAELWEAVQAFSQSEEFVRLHSEGDISVIFKKSVREGRIPSDLSDFFELAEKAPRNENHYDTHGKIGDISEYVIAPLLKLIKESDEPSLNAITSYIQDNNDHKIFSRDRSGNFTEYLMKAYAEQAEKNRQEAKSRNRIVRLERGSIEGKNDERNEMKRAQKSSNSSERKHSTQLNRGESR